MTLNEEISFFHLGEQLIDTIGEIFLFKDIEHDGVPVLECQHGSFRSSRLLAPDYSPDVFRSFTFEKFLGFS